MEVDVAELRQKLHSMESLQKELELLQWQKAASEQKGSNGVVPPHMEKEAFLDNIKDIMKDGPVPPVGELWKRKSKSQPSPHLGYGH